MAIRFPARKNNQIIYWIWIIIHNHLSVNLEQQLPSDSFSFNGDQRIWSQSFHTGQCCGPPGNREKLLLQNLKCTRRAIGPVSSHQPVFLRYSMQIYLLYIGVGGDYCYISIHCSPGLATRLLFQNGHLR